jgi:hypothetical protein
MDQRLEEANARIVRIVVCLNTKQNEGLKEKNLTCLAHFNCMF